ncbi:hypothetical protein [Beijerinckia sp. L45]|uniref:hypothetical protein n=1 Tax=Beijerinckia sp. L45 TaxID=1641855 RepID=UPI00131AE0EE|nr:hypothetical protein [Beijerinckia sp. L45]
MKFVAAVFLSTLVVAPFVPQQLRAETAAKRDTASLLFDNPDWAIAPAGSKITYDYSRKTAPEFGVSFDDTIGVSLEPGDNAASRKVEVRMFSGGRQLPAGPFDSMSTNPVLLLVFESHLQALAKIFQANPRYIKNAIRKAWRESPTIEDVQLTVAGKTVPGTRITIRPFLNDPEKDRMKGLDGMTYAVDIADSTPGEIVAIDIHAPDGAPPFSETLHYQAEKTP